MTPDFSIICVFNNQNILSNFLERGLEDQTYSNFEKIFIDNRTKECSSASSALNTGAQKASGRYYVFAHQDVKSPPNYLIEAKEYLDNIDDLGIAGAAGVRESGECNAEGVNIIQHGEERRNWERGSKISKPTEVDSLIFSDKITNSIYWYCSQ